MTTTKITTSILHAILLSACSGLLLACPADPENQSGDDDAGTPITPDARRPPPPPPPGDVEVGPSVTLISDEDGVREVSVAALTLAFVYFDLETGEERFIDTPEDSTEWDIGFARERVPSNGGASGTGNVAVAVFPDADFDSMNEVPTEGFLQDLEDEDLDGFNEHVISGENGHGTKWWDYDFDTHVLSALPMVFVIRSVEGHHFAFEMLDYYNEEGDSGYPRFRYKAIGDEPAPSLDAGPLGDASQ